MAETKKQNIALFCGGDSSEYKVSINSALNVLQNIDNELFTPYLIFITSTHWYAILNGEEKPIYEPTISLEDVIESRVKSPSKYIAKEIDKTSFSIGGVRLDKALIMIHGTPGENGLLQGYLEMMNIPFSSCSSFVSAITFDKHSCKRFLDFAGVKMAKDIFIRREVPYSHREIVRQIGFPMFIKPTVGGSSFGVSKVKCEEELESAIQSAFKECDTIIAEEAIKGRELTCGLYKKDGEMRKLPVTEIVTDREFFDYEAKYLGHSQEICPAQIDNSVAIKVHNLSERIYNYMGCRGLVRIDYILSESNELYFLEVNTIPGMTKMSLVPQMLKVANIDLKEFLTNTLNYCSL